MPTTAAASPSTATSLRPLRSALRSAALALAASAALAGCGGELAMEEPEIEGEDLGPYAEQVPWEEYMATAAMDTVEGVANSTACNSGAIHGLSKQIVAEMNCIRGGLMTDISGYNVRLTSASVLPYLQTAAANKLKAATTGRSRLGINSALRSVAQQWILYRWYLTKRCGVLLAAKPGASNHEDGLAFDTSDYNAWKGIMPSYSYRWYGSSDPYHFDYTGGGPDARGVLAFQRLWNNNRPGDKIAEDGIYGPQTEARIKQSPRTGFTGTQRCR